MKLQQATSVITAALLLGALSGCASSAPSTELSGASDTAHMSAAETAAMSDGKVTASEYKAGFLRYQSCMEKAGWEVLVSDNGGYLIEYSFPTAGTTDDTRCYGTEFGAIDDAWQLQNIDRSDTTNALRTCLADAGVTPGKTRAEIDSQLAAAGIKPQTCFPH
ncbi:MAG TPA: hypothetical protein VIJ11_06760 [Galbitalea sp.]